MRFTTTTLHFSMAFAVVLATQGCRKKADTASVGDSSTSMAPALPPAPSASIDCAAASGDIAILVCGDTGLLSLDRKLATVYLDAQARQGNPPPVLFTAEQRGWIKERDDCWKSTNQRACVDSAYTLRIAELQATNLLVPTRGPVIYACPRPDGGRDEIVAMFAQTNPRSVVLQKGDRSIVAYGTGSGGAVMYRGANVDFRVKGSEAQVTWFGTATTCHEQAGTS